MICPLGKCDRLHICYKSSLHNTMWKGENSTPFLINIYVLIICYLCSPGMANLLKYKALGSRAF